MALGSGCGYVGDPLPPLANIPEGVVDLAAVQRGGRLIVHFTAPAATTEGYTIPAPVRLDLRVGTAAPPFNANAWAAQAREIQPPAEIKPLAEYDIPAAEWVGKEVTIGARAIAANGKAGNWSNFVNLTVVPPPPTPSKVIAETTANGVRLTWQGGPATYRVFRRDAPEGQFAQVASVTVPEWLDRQAEFGKTYDYVVQQVVQVGERLAESELSAPLSVTPKDKFPPAAPAGLRAVAAPQSIELAWDRNGEADLAGYRVYRATGDGAFERISDLLLVPAFSDRKVEAGKSYRYEVSAVDQAGNESARSAAVAAGL
jgi:hypothetical protein